MKVRTPLKLSASILISVLFYSPSILQAQPASLYRGDSVRVTCSASVYLAQCYVGTLIDLRNDSLFLRTASGGMFIIPSQHVVRLQVARGQKTNTKQGAIIGGFAGGLGLGLIAACGASSASEGWLTPTPGEAFVLGLISGSLLGSVTGAIIGRGWESVRWVKVPIDAISIQDRAPVTPAGVTEKEGEEIRQEGASGRKRRWGFSVTLGTTSGGPTKDIEKAMVRDGFNKTSPGGFWGGPVPHPFSSGTGLTWSVQLTYSLSRGLDCSIVFGRAAFGSTHGYTDPVAFLDLNYSSTTISPMVIYRAPKLLQFGLGPTIFVSKIDGEQKTQVGAMFGASLLFPQRTRFFVKLDAHQRLVPKATYGPFKAGWGHAVKYLKPFEAHFSHLFISGGFGVRL